MAEINKADLVPIPVRRGFRAWYAKPAVQVFMIAFTAFLCPGMFNALSGIGGGGQVDAKAADNGNVALYSTFAATSFFSGSINNKLGSRVTFGIGATGYALYIGSLLSFNIHGDTASSNGFIIAAGAILGVCAGLFWTAQGSMVLAYATEQTKGRYFALFWGVFNLGAVTGNAIELGLTYNSTSNTVGNGVYAAFLVLSSLSCFLPFMLVDPGTMVRDDGTRVIVHQHPHWLAEIKGLFNTLRTDFWVVLLFPLFLSSNWFYTVTFNDYNGALFTLRTRALNSLLYYLFQIFGAYGFGLAIDSKRFRRVVRAWGGYGFLFAFMMAVMGGLYSVIKGYNRNDVITRIDLKDSTYAGHVILYIFLGLMESIYQAYIYWLIGALSNDPAQLACYVGFYKGIQSAGNAGVYRLDANKDSYMVIFGTTWGLCIAGLVFALPLIMLRIKDHTEEPVVMANDTENESIETAHADADEKHVVAAKV